MTEKVNSIDDLTDEDFTNPTRSVELPQLPEAVSNAIGAKGKPVIIKKNIFVKNKGNHGDLTPQDSRKIIKTALYNPRLYGQNLPKSRPYNWILVRLADQQHSFILIEVNDNKDNYEIVSWHYLDDVTLQQKRNQADREGGRILTLSIDDSAAGNTSDNSVVSTHKDTQSSGKNNASTSLAENGGKAENGQEYDPYYAYLENMPIEETKWPKDIDNGSIVKKSGKEGVHSSVYRRTAKTATATVALKGDDLYIKFSLYGIRRMVVLRNARKYGAVDIATRFENFGIFDVEGRLIGDAVKELYKSKGLRIGSTFNYSPLLKPISDVLATRQQRSPGSPRPQNRLGISPAGGVPPQERDAIDQAARDLAGKLGGNVVLVSSPAQIPDSETGKKVRSMIEKGTPVKGWYDTKTGKAYVFLPNAESVQDARQSIMHEAVAHKGLRGLLGQQGFDGLCDTVWNNMPLVEQLRILEYVAGKKFDTMAQFYQAATEKNRRAAADEWLASFAENARIENPALWQKVVSAIRNALRSLGINLRLSNNDILDLLRGSYSNLQQGEINTAGGNAGIRRRDAHGSNAYKRDFLVIGDAVSSLTGNEFARVEGKSLTDQVEKYFQSLGGKAMSPIFGEVTLDRKGADDSLAHGMGRKKAVAYAAVKDVIEKGVLLDSDRNHKGRGYDSHVVAAPIKINGKDYICSVVIIVSKSGNRFYLHEVVEKERLLSDGSNTAQKQPQHPKAIANILQKIISASDENGNSSDPVRFRIATTAEEREIETRAKANGTWLKAPNGKPTNLTPKQWVQVRTQAFKNWFGNWELMHKRVNLVKAQQYHGFSNFNEARDWAKDNIARTYSNEETDGKGEIRISNTAINKFLSEGSVNKSESKDVHLSVLKVLPDVIRTSVDAEQHYDHVKKDGVRSASSAINKNIIIHRLYGAAEIDGRIYRIKVTLKEDETNNAPNKAYSYEATKIELLDGLSEEAVTSSRNSNNSIPTTKLLKGVEKSYEKGKYLLDDFSKVVDENGEPLVVYRGITVNDKDEVRLPRTHHGRPDCRRNACPLFGYARGATPARAAAENRKRSPLHPRDRNRHGRDCPRQAGTETLLEERGRLPAHPLRKRGRSSRQSACRHAGRSEPVSCGKAGAQAHQRPL